MQSEDCSRKKEIGPDLVFLRDNMSLTLSSMSLYTCFGFVLRYCCLFQTRRCVETQPESQHRRKKRITRMIALIILLFAIFWFPIHVLNIYTKLYPDFPKTEVLFIIKLLAHTLSYTNSCLNPLIYAFLNDIFQKSFLKTFPSVTSWFSCMIGISEEHENTRVTNMVDQAIQAGTNDNVEANSDVIQRQNILDTKLL